MGIAPRADRRNGRDAFHYAQRAEIGPQVDDLPVDDGGEPTGFDLAIVGADPERPETFTQPPWTMAGADGTDRLAATLSATERLRPASTAA